MLTALAEAGRPDLLKTWGDHNWAVDDELVARAHRVAAAGTPPIRPLTPTARDITELAEGYAEIRRTPHSRRQRPTELLVGRAAACGHFSAVLALLDTLPLTDEFNDRPAAAFSALWQAHTGFDRPPW